MVRSLRFPVHHARESNRLHILQRGPARPAAHPRLSARARRRRRRGPRPHPRGRRKLPHGAPRGDIACLRDGGLPRPPLRPPLPPPPPATPTAPPPSPPPPP